MHGRARVQQMPYPEELRLDPKLRGKPKGIKQVLIERGLWRECRADGLSFYWTVQQLVVVQGVTEMKVVIS